MKNILTFNVLLLISALLAGQKVDYSEDWLNQLENPKNKSSILIPDNLIGKYEALDFSSLIQPKTEFLGFIGNDYQRININFTKVEKDLNPRIYRISGHSKVLNNNCDFTGIIEVKQIRAFKSLHFGVDENLKDKGIKAQGALIGNYNLQENSSQSHYGEFSGIMTLYWYLDKNDNLLYDDIRLYSDEYRNNQYIGIWEDYITKKKKTCNWGEYRIPFSGDLDVGAAEFYPNKKYHAKGWGNK
jgi:hypothetical protein